MRGGNRVLQSSSQGLFMKNLVIAILMVLAPCAASAQDQSNSTRAGAGATSLNEAANLPVERIGPNDLIGITVYDSPELTRTFRVDSDGEIRLPMLRKHI